MILRKVWTIYHSWGEIRSLKKFRWWSVYAILNCQCIETVTVKRWIALTWVTVGYSPLTRTQSGVPDMSPSELDYFRYRVTLYHEPIAKEPPFLNDATKEGELTRFQCSKRFNLADDLIGLRYSRGIVKWSDRNSTRARLPLHFYLMLLLLL